MNVGFKIAGVICLVLGVIGALGVLGTTNPLSIISDPLFNLTKLFLTDSGSFFLWVFIIVLGLTLVGPSKGFIKGMATRK
ncbi:MAG: hypothetical protein WC307_00670 [Candidatus Nanoarchaeia archaeon]|jgi:hypothetical protein